MLFIANLKSAMAFLFSKVSYMVVLSSTPTTQGHTGTITCTTTERDRGLDMTYYQLFLRLL